ncbi:MAG: hypothetical protein RMJ33_08295, partial [Saprospiraceae bacterium]|nr:hypothetical protein [Saprospiraceae bacterium]
MSALPRLATLFCLTLLGAHAAHAQSCVGVSCDISYAPGVSDSVVLCLNSQGEAQITSGLMATYTTTSNPTCCSVVRVWENAAATNPLTPSDPDYDLDCTDVGRMIVVWVTREVNLPPSGTGRSAAIRFRIFVRDCSPPTIVCPPPASFTCASSYT